MLLSLAEPRLGIAERLTRLIPDRRDPTRITHTFADMIRARIVAICCGYENCDDLDALRTDPAFKLACGRLPDTGMLKVAAMVVETRHRVRIAFAAACPEADVIAGLSAAILRRRI